MFIDRFDRCRNCGHHTFLRTTSVYRCPKCFGLFCDKCRAGNWLLGYKCPHCTFNISSFVELTRLRIGTC